MSCAILIIVFNAIGYKLKIDPSSIKRMQIYIAIVIAAVAKFLFLTAAIKLIFPIIFDCTLPEKFAALMMTPQLFTALAEGVFYLILAKLLITAELVQK